MKFSGYDSTWILVKDSDGDFTSGTTVVGALDASGAISNVTLANGEYFTLAKPSPLGVCSDGTIGVTQTSFEEFTIDSSLTPMLDSGYVSYEINTGTGDSFNDLWIKIDNFSDASKLHLAPSENGLYHIGKLDANSSVESFFYLQGSETNIAQTYDVTLYEGHPNFNGVASCKEQVGHTKVLDQIKARANKVNSVVATAPSL